MKFQKGSQQLESADEAQAPRAPGSQPMSRPLRIGHVPEHFCAPLHLGAKRGLFKKHFVDVELVTCAGGTGEMTTKLRNNEIDLAIALTEGIIANIANAGDDFRIIGTYVDSPLTWAVSAGKDSVHNSLDSLRGATVGVSRLGSGSHIMSIVMADERGWLDDSEDAPFKFAVLKDFKGLRDGINSGLADVFMWDTFMSKPYHDNKEINRIGEVVTPWPAFLIAARTDVLDRDAEVIHRLLTAVSEACTLFINEKAKHVKYVSDNCHLTMEDAAKWFTTVHYPLDCAVVSQAVIDHCLQTLMRAQVVHSVPETIQFVDTRATTIRQ